MATSMGLSQGISIHDLTRRSTTSQEHLLDRLEISIHDLTRRSTETSVGMTDEEFISIHDLTRRSTMNYILQAGPI